ncbi:unnamed protein product [Calicophoron daubneyi]|uniref:USP domain-containing protein n=1 Tax=Calicophoron daubneyi TaxID=300641 RepID=A0AAV2TM39_CALDB
MSSQFSESLTVNPHLVFDPKDTFAVLEQILPPDFPSLPIKSSYARDHILAIILGTFAVGAASFTAYKLFRFFRSLQITDQDLPMGLPNPRNFCYLNALLQAMSTNISLVRFLKKNAKLRRNKLLYCLVCLLKGLRCSSRYIAANKLDTVLRDVHVTLLAEMTSAKSWAIDEQQDAHELFNFFMDLACCRETGCTALRAGEGLISASQFMFPHYEKVVPRCFQRIQSVNSLNSYAIRSALRTEVFQQHLLVNQVTCTNCDYRSSPVLQPEAYITVFFDSASCSQLPLHTQSSRSRTKSHKQPLLASVPTLCECLAKQFGTSERLPDLRCPKCQTPSHLSKECPLGCCQQEHWIAHLPTCLVLHVQRTNWSGQGLAGPPGQLSGLSGSGTSFFLGGFGTKRSDYLSFPYRLNMAPFMLSERTRKQSSVNSQHPAGDNVGRGDSETDICQPNMYILRSVLVHQGESINCGHYITYRAWRRANSHSHRKKESLIFRACRGTISALHNFFSGMPYYSTSACSSWILTSDSHVHRVSTDEVRSSLAYLLFYERDTRHFRYRSTSSDSHRAPMNDSQPKPRSGLTTSTFDSLNSEPSGWDPSDEEKHPTSYDRGTDEEDADGDDYEDEEDDESDEVTDTEDEDFSGCTKADIIRAFALAASSL